MSTNALEQGRDDRRLKCACGPLDGNEGPGWNYNELYGEYGIKPIKSIGPDGIIIYQQDSPPSPNGHHRAPLDGDVLPD